MSEFEATLIRQRSIEAIHQKARRGELWIPVPVGFCWTSTGKIEKHPDQRVQQAIGSVFAKMTELGSMRQVLIWFRENNVCLPAGSFEGGERGVIWRLPLYQSIQAILTNPVYAGAYAFGKTETRAKVVDGRPVKRSGFRRPRSQWMILIRDHHPGYLSWEEYERNQAMILANTHMQSGTEPKAGRGGRALLSGLLRCRRCGRMLYVSYSGPRATVIRYECRGELNDCGQGRCVSFGGLRVDADVAREVLQAIKGNAIEAALEAAEQMHRQRQDLRKCIELELEQARYEARLAARRYDAVDPEQRLVAAELEARWNVALQKVQDLEDRLQEFDGKVASMVIPDKQILMSLAQDLPAVWNSPSTDTRLKQRIIRILIREIVADVDEEKREIILLIHWAGGRHSELRLQKSGLGRHRHCTNLEAVEIIRKMAGTFSDEQIAATLNRLRLRTGADNAWNQNRVYSVRHYHHLPAVSPDERNINEVTLREAAQRLDLSPPSVRRMIQDKILPAYQVVEGAPWQIPVDGLELDAVHREAMRLRNRIRAPRSVSCNNQQSMFSDS